MSEKEGYNEESVGGAAGCFAGRKHTHLSELLKAQQEKAVLFLRPRDTCATPWQEREEERKRRERRDLRRRARSDSPAGKKN